MFWSRCSLGSSILWLGMVPAAVFACVALFRGTWILEGPDRGLIEDPIFLTYFAFAPLLLVRVQRVRRRVQTTLRFVDEQTGSHNEAELDVFEPRILPRFRSRDVRGFATPTDRLILNVVHWTAFLGGVLFLIIGTRSHWLAAKVYGFDIWCSGGEPIEFNLRFLYEALIYLAVFPYFAASIAASVVCLWRSGSVLLADPHLEYRRFAADNASGVSVFGQHSLSNVWSLGPFFLPVVAYFVSYPVTPQLLIGTCFLVLATVTAFFVPLVSGHLAMQKMKEAELREMERCFSRIYASIKAELGTNSDVVRVQPTVELYVNLRSMYVDTLALHTWPFSLNVLARFSTIVGGAAALLASQVISVLGK